MRDAEDSMLAALWAWLLLFLLAGVILFALGCCAFAHDHDHPELDQWYAGLMQPDNPTVPCCGKSDAYWCDTINVKDGKTFCTITDDRDDAPLMRPHVAVGTQIEIPNHKLKWDQRNNPTGHSVVFLSTSGHVWCFVQGTLI